MRLLSHLGTPKRQATRDAKMLVGKTDETTAREILLGFYYS